MSLCQQHLRLVHRSIWALAFCVYHPDICVQVPSEQIQFSIYTENMTIRLEEKIVLFHEKQRKQRNVISADRVLLCLCVSLFIFSLIFSNISMDLKPLQEILQESRNKSYKAAVVDVSVITPKTCYRVSF